MRCIAVMLGALLASSGCKKSESERPGAAPAPTTAGKTGSAGGFSADLAKELGDTKPAGSAEAAGSGDAKAGSAATSGDAAGSAAGSAVAMADPKAGSAAASGDVKAGSATAAGDAKDAKAGDAKVGDAKAGDAKAGDAKAGDAKAGDAKAGDAKAGDAKAGDAKAGDSKVASAGDAKADAKAGSAQALTSVVVPPVSVPPPPATPKPESHGPVKVPAELAAIKMSLLPNWDRDVDEAGTFQYVVRIKGTQTTKTFVFHYGYDDPKAPTDHEQYKKYLQDAKVLTGELRDRQRGGAWFLEGIDAMGQPAFRYQVLYGGKRLVCYGALYKDTDSNRLGDDRDQTVIQAKQICETLAL